jgi:hypothetical protein
MRLRNRVDYRTVFSVQQFFCSIQRERNFGLRTRRRPVQACKDRFGAFSKQSILRESRRGPQSANALRDILGRVVTQNGEFDEVPGHSRCYLLFGHRVRSECAAQGGSGKAESADGLQARWNGPGHKAMGWRLRRVRA